VVNREAGAYPQNEQSSIIYTNCKLLCNVNFVGVNVLVAVHSVPSSPDRCIQSFSVPMS
jgi:hypothetical protein